MLQIKIIVVGLWCSIEKKTINIETMDTLNLKRGTKVKNQYGETLTVLEVIGGLMVRTYEDFNNLYHCTKLFYEGKAIKA